MAKNDKAKDSEIEVEVEAQSDPSSLVSDVSQIFTGSPDEPVVQENTTRSSPSEPLMALHKQEERHDSHRNPQQALQPGRDEVPAHMGLMGEIEELLIRAEKSGNHSVEYGLQHLLVLLGEIRVHLFELSKNIDESLKPQLDKAMALFKS